MRSCGSGLTWEEQVKAESQIANLRSHSKGDLTARVRFHSKGETSQ